jgi:2-methylcitrate dehydratase PrpD
MVAAGCTGVEDVFSGERNFFVAYDETARTGSPPEPAALVRGLGVTYEIANTNIKRWTVGSPIQAALDALRALIVAERVAASDVERVTVRISRLGANTTDNRDMPNICMQHLCAVMLLDGTITFESAHDDARMRDPAVLALRRRIRLIGDDALQKLLPQRHAIVTLDLKHGRQLTHHTRAVRGTAQNPMSRQEVEDKGLALMTPPLGAKRARAVCKAIWQIEKVQDLRELRPLLQR